MTRRDAYRVVGPAYDALTVLFSGRAILRAKTTFLHDLAPGQRVLFAGVGHGRDAVVAAGRGAHVTVVDLSPTMLARCRAHLAAAGHHDVVFVAGDVRDHAAPRSFDVVVANFFLNVFAPDEARRVLAHLVAQLKPGGIVVVGDFHAASRHALVRALQQAHWWLAIAFFGLVAGNALHPLLEVARLLDDAGVDVVEQRSFRVLGAPLYQATRGRAR
jgi:demethylmenaquinone methyltransferase/2-methoxy-6-polyprenyl-1,4-benzoquinol methylase